ncbi:MAG: RNA polymerase sigma factor [Candidatus Omnitrophica bacterium]|nr:RNA polymerase sigma factor [Candidatus Omnitrophota bacterium]
MDRRLEDGLRKGKTDAFERLFELYADSLLRLGYALLSNAAEAEDAVQDALVGFIEALRNNRFRGGNGAVSAYLRRSVRNRCIDRMRRSGEMPFSLLEDDAPLNDSRVAPITPSSVLDEKRFRKAIEIAIRKLPDAQRAVIVLRMMEEYSYQQIADELHISIDHVKNLLGRARQKLRRELKPFVYEVGRE